MLRWVFESIKYSERNIEVKRLLQQHFETIHQLTDDNGCTILHIVSDNNNLPLLSFILSLFDAHQQLAPIKSNWVDQPDGQGSTALHYAAFRGSLQGVQLLESHGANYSIVNLMGLNCLHFAAQGGSPLLMYYFKEKGISINCTDINGSTPLHWAAYTGMYYAVTALLSWESDHNQQENQGMTPLHLAVMSGKVKVTVRLLMAGCDKKIRNFKDQLPIDLAEQKGNTRLIEMLKDRNKCCSEFTLRHQISPPTKKRECSFAMTIIIFAATLFFNAFILYPVNSGLIIGFAIASLGMGLIGGICFIILYCSDPGTLKVGKNDKNSYLRLLSQNHPRNICFECSIKKPVRSRHCYICCKCVMVFDHHCPWIGNCVGSNNSLIFTLSLGLCLVYNLLTFVTHLLCNLFFMADIATLNYYSLSSIELGCVVISGLALLITILVMIPVGYLLVRQLKLAGQGITFFQLYQRLDKTKREGNDVLTKRKMTGQGLLKKKITLTSQQPSNLQEFIQKQLENGQNNHIKKNPEDASCFQNCQYIFCKNRYVREYGRQEQ